MSRSAAPLLGPGALQPPRMKTWLDYAPTQHRRVGVEFPEVKAMSALMFEGGQDLLLSTIFMEAMDFGWTLWEAEVRDLNEEHELHESLPSWLISTLRHELRTELSLCNYGLHPRHGVLISHALNHNSRLQRLVLQHNAIEDEGVAALGAALADNTSLQEIHLVACDMGDEGCIALAAGLGQGKCPVSFLQLCHNKIGSKGAAALAKALPSTKINELNISDNPIGGEGSKALEAAGFEAKGSVYLKLMAGGAGTDFGNKANGAGGRKSGATRFKWEVTGVMPKKASERSPASKEAEKKRQDKSFWKMFS